MNCIILGDKYQTGMKSKGCAALVRVNKTINNICHQYSSLISVFGNDINIIYVYGFDGKKFLEFYEKSDLNINAVLNDKYNIYNEAFSLSLVKNYLLSDNTLIINGYQKINKTLMKKVAHKNNSYIFMNKNNNDDAEAVGCIINNNNTVENLSLDLDNSIQNMYYLNKDCCKTLFDILQDNKTHNNFIFELLNKLIDNGHTIQPILVN